MTAPKSAANPFWIAYEWLAMGLGLSALAIICLAWLPFAMLLHPLLPQNRAQPLGRWMIMHGFRAYLCFLEFFCACRFNLTELDALRDEGPLILAANHPSLLDAVMIISRFPNAVCVMKAALLDNILFGAAARLARYIRNNAPLEMILKAREELQQGAHLLIFPEGSRTRNFPIDTCSPGTALIAGRSGVPVQTLLIEFSSPYLGKDWPLFKRPALPLHCHIRLGLRFPATTDATALSAEIESYFRSELGKKTTSTAAI